MSKKPTVLMILDGYGLNDKCEHNAVCEAKTPIMDQLMSQCPYVKGQASGLAVGLPDGQMGNSEVGHLNMGAGRVVYQELTRITKAIQDGDFFENEELVKAVENAKANNSALHMFGLLSDGGVHSHITHVFGLLELAKRKGLEKVYVHCFLDGRDTPPASGKSYVEQLQAKMDEIGVGEIGVISGRYYAMDRDNRWDRVELAYKALTKGEGVEGTDAAEAVQASYDAEKTDEFVLPTVLKKDGKPVATIQDKDSVIFFNFRPDRARELTRAFCADEFTGFESLFEVHPGSKALGLVAAEDGIAVAVFNGFNSDGNEVARLNVDFAEVVLEFFDRHISFALEAGVHNHEVVFNADNFSGNNRTRTHRLVGFASGKELGEGFGLVGFVGHCKKRKKHTRHTIALGGVDKNAVSWGDGTKK